VNWFGWWECGGKTGSVYVLPVIAAAIEPVSGFTLALGEHDAAGHRSYFLGNATLLAF
jgi:hypothetical protein